MGHLFSRAFRRLTQCTSHARNQHHQQQQQQAEAKKEKETATVVAAVAESIPVGQSIDSAEYHALETRDEPAYATPSENEHHLEEEQQQQQQQEEQQQQQVDGSNKQQDVEDAVIKIQALVRGHLTRKALKDANQLHHSLPTVLGQCQFDEESLTKNPPSAVFLPSSPLTIQQQQPSQPQPNNKDANNSRARMESIAELSETKNTPNEEQSERVSAQAPIKLQMPTREPQERDMGSPTSPTSVRTFSTEANASIDLDGSGGGVTETPMSASILISDHNMKPAADKNLASVLHIREIVTTHGEQTMTPATTTQVVNPAPQVCGDLQSTLARVQEPPTTNGGSSEVGEEAAAAIKIQSAFRGYRTRKNSPYRTRSPNQSLPTATDATTSTTTTNNNSTVCNSLTSHHDTHSNSLSVLGQDDDDDDEEAEAESEQSSEAAAAAAIGRRMSRPRRRDSSPPSAEADQFCYKPTDAMGQRIIQGASSIDEFTTTEDTVREAASVRAQQQEQEQRADSATKPDEEDEDATLSSMAAPLTDSLLKHTQQQQQAIDQSQSNTLDECGFSAALDTTQTTNALSSSVNYGALDEVLATTNGLPRASIGTTKSDVSVDLDTDSSFLGAALSLNETTDISVGNVLVTEASVQENETELEDIEDTQQDPPLGPSSEISLDQTVNEVGDEELTGVKSSDNNYDDELELEGRELVRELEEAAGNEEETEKRKRVEEVEQREEDVDDECALEDEEASTNQLEAATEVELGETESKQQEEENMFSAENDQEQEQEVEEEEATASVAPSLLNEQEQHAIELESDDIERRDPRGHVTEERAKSPLIKSDDIGRPDFSLADTRRSFEQVELNEPNNGEQLDRLAVTQELDSTLSGRSSPALCSSHGAESSSNSNSNNEESADENNQEANDDNRGGDEDKTSGAKQQQQQTRQQQTASRNRKRNNRNKRKNKK